MNHRELVLKTTNCQMTEKWLLEEGYLKPFIMCSHCREQKMKPRIKENKLYYRCSKCKSDKSIYSGTFLYNSKKEITEIVDLIYFWSINVLQITCRKEINSKSMDTSQNWYDLLRLFCVKYMLKNNSGKIGGVGSVVEIDECKFSKRKFNFGRTVRSAWVVGGIDQLTRKTFFVEVIKRDAETLESVIKENVVEGTTIFTDKWAGYNGLSCLGFTHKTVNHKKNFIDPDSGANTQLIENSWGVFKRSLRSRFLNKRSDICSFFAEYLFKRQHKDDVFLAVLKNLYD